MSEICQSLEESQILSINDIHQILNAGKNQPKWATYPDYLSANGSLGLEIIRLPNGLYIVRHKFNGKIVEVRSHQEQVIRYGVTFLSNFPGRLFAGCLLWQFHGQPCEQYSRRLGGDGYPQVRK